MRLKTKKSLHAIFRPTVRRMLLENGFKQEGWVGKRAVRYQKGLYMVECICPPTTDLTCAGSENNNKVKITRGLMKAFYLFVKN